MKLFRLLSVMAFAVAVFCGPKLEFPTEVRLPSARMIDVVEGVGITDHETSGPNLTLSMSRAQLQAYLGPPVAVYDTTSDKKYKQEVYAFQDSRYTVSYSSASMLSIIGLQIESDHFRTLAGGIAYWSDYSELFARYGCWPPLTKSSLAGYPRWGIIFDIFEGSQRIRSATIMYATTQPLPSFPNSGFLHRISDLAVLTTVDNDSDGYASAFQISCRFDIPNDSSYIRIVVTRTAGRIDTAYLDAAAWRIAGTGPDNARQYAFAGQGWGTDTIGIHVVNPGLLPIIDTMIVIQQESVGNDTSSSSQDTSAPGAYYSFNSAFSDTTGHFADAVNNGSTPTSDRYGTPGFAREIQSLAWISLDRLVFDGLADFTYCGWYRISSSTNNRSHAILSLANAGFANELFVTYNLSDSTFESYQQVVSGANNSPMAKSDRSSALLDYNWHFVAFRRQDSTATMFVDSSRLRFDVPVMTRALRVDVGGAVLGQDQDALGGGFDATQNLNGSVDDVAIFGRALSDAEVLSLYGSSKP